MSLPKGQKIKVVRPFYLGGKVQEIGTVLELGKEISVSDGNMVYFAHKATDDLKAEPEAKKADVPTMKTK